MFTKSNVGMALFITVACVGLGYYIHLDHSKMIERSQANAVRPAVSKAEILYKALISPEAAWTYTDHAGGFRVSMPKSVSRGKPYRNEYEAMIPVNSENGNSVNIYITYVPKCVDHDSFTRTLKGLKGRGTWEEGTIAGKKVWIRRDRDLPKDGDNRYDIWVLMPITETRWATFRVIGNDSNITLCERAIEAAVESFEVTG